MSLYLTWLADDLRAAGLNVVEYHGWRTRARGSGGYSSAPLCVMEHHTASGPSWDGQRDADYCAVGDPDAPLSNLYIDRTGRVWVLAAGATNTNGKGQALTFSRGTVPADGMNTRAVGIECGNNGIGEAWPVAQIDALILTANVVNRQLGNVPADIAGHVHYAVGRKIDPATAAAVEGAWRPRSINSSGSWNLDDMRAEHTRRAAAPVPKPETPDEEDDEMDQGLLVQGTPSGSLQVADKLLTTRRPITGDAYGPLLGSGLYQAVTLPDADVDLIPYTPQRDVT